MSRQPKPQAPQSEYVPIESIIEWEDNPRNNESAVEAVANSIKEFDFTQPILVQKSSNRIICGHTRYKASKHLHKEWVLVRFLDISDEKAKRLALIDNKTSELATWDEGKLAELISDMESDDIDSLIGGGFSEKYIDQLLGEFENPFGDDDEESDEDANEEENPFKEEESDEDHDKMTLVIEIEIDINEASEFSDDLEEHLNRFGHKFKISTK